MQNVGETNECAMNIPSGRITVSLPYEKHFLNNKTRNKQKINKKLRRGLWFRGASDYKMNNKTHDAI